MADTKTVQISGVGRPTARVLRAAEALHGRRFSCCLYEAVEDSRAVSGLANLLDRAMLASTSKDGRLDLKDMAIYMIREMKGAQR